MKNSLSLQQLALEIRRQNAVKEDYLVRSPSLQMEQSGKSLVLRMLGENSEDRIEPLDMNEIFHSQLGTYLNIPSKYYERMQTDFPELLLENCNRWLQRDDSQRMVRTLDGTARAFLSNRYRRIDNNTIAETVLPLIGQMPDARVESCAITDRRMYLKVVNPRLEAEVAPGDIVQSGIVISNSEVGQGAFCVQPLIYRLVCSNGMVVNDAATRRHHIGRSSNSSEDFTIYSDQTLKADDRAFLMKVQDTVRAAIDEAKFHTVIERMRDARSVPMNTVDIPNVVKLACKECGITDAESGGVLQHLLEGKDLSLYGLANAITRHSQDVASYDRASDLEAIGYNILTISPRIWQRINEAA